MVIITSTVVIASLALIGLIVAVSGAVMLAPFVRDIIIGESTPVELAENDVINNILDDPSIPDDEKIKLIMALIKSEEKDWTHDLMIIVFVLVAAYVAVAVIKK